MLLERIWTFLNAPFAIWLFSTVAIGLISFFYSKRQAVLAEKRIQQARSDRINLEIAMRMDHFTREVKVVPQDKEAYEHWSVCIKLLLDGMPYTAVFEDTGERKMLALLWELKLLAQTKTDQNRVQKTIDATKELIAIITEGWGDQKRATLNQETKEALIQKARSEIKAFEQWQV